MSQTADREALFRVIVVDDEPLARKLLIASLANFPDFRRCSDLEGQWFRLRLVGSAWLCISEESAG